MAEGGENPLEGLTCQELVEKLVFLFQNDKEENAIDEALDWFLYAYSPEHNFEGVTQNGEALKNPQLLKIIMTKIKEVYEPEIFFETFNVVSSVGLWIFYSLFYYYYLFLLSLFFKMAGKFSVTQLI